MSTFVEADLVTVDEEVMSEEHSIYSLMPFIRKSLPDAWVLPFIFRDDASSSTLDQFVAELSRILPDDAVIVASIDFSHYQTSPVADFHDELAKSVIRSFDYDRLSALETDSTPSLHAFLKLMEARGAESIAYEIHSNAAKLTGDAGATNITSYYSPYFVAGERDTSDAVSVLNFGDIMIDRNVKKQIDTYGTDYLLRKTGGRRDRFRGWILFRQILGPFADSRRPTTKSIAFRFDPGLFNASAI